MTVFADSSRFIMDLGMHNGDDAAYYLAEGFEVVALEPDPVLANAARSRFADAIAAGRMKVVEAAIGPQRGTLPFHLNEADDSRSSLDAQWAAREGAATRSLDVTTLTLGDLFNRFGTPLYIKIDVEGAEETVLRQLQDQLVKPLYVSVADRPSGFDFIAALVACGYDGFQLVDQSQVPSMIDPDVSYSLRPGPSGPFGKGLPGPWLAPEEFEALYADTVRKSDGTPIAPTTSGFDIHATRL